MITPSYAKIQKQNDCLTFCFSSSWVVVRVFCHCHSQQHVSSAALKTYFYKNHFLSILVCESLDLKFSKETTNQKLRFEVPHRSNDRFFATNVVDHVSDKCFPKVMNMASEDIEKVVSNIYSYCFICRGFVKL